MRRTRMAGFLAVLVLVAVALWLVLRGPRTVSGIPSEAPSVTAHAADPVPAAALQAPQLPEPAEPLEQLAKPAGGEVRDAVSSAPAVTSASRTGAPTKRAQNYIVTGRVLFDPGLFRRRDGSMGEFPLSVKLVPKKRGSWSWPAVGGLVDDPRSLGDGGERRFEFTKVPAGAYTVYVEAGDLVLVELNDVDSQPAGEPQDYRLDPIDLREQLTAIWLEVSAPEVPVGCREVWYRLRKPSDDERWHRWTQCNAPGDFLVAPGRDRAFDLEILASGYCGASLQSIDEDCAVRLERVFPLRFAMDADCLDLARRGITADVMREGFDPHIHEPRKLFLDVAGQARLEDGGCGPYRVLLHIWRGVSDLNGPTVTVETNPQVHEITGEPEQTVWLHVDRGVFEQALADLERR